MSKAQFLLSVLVPVYNEEDNIQPLIDRLLPMLKKYTYELIFIDDGSKDNTVNQIKAITKENDSIKLLSFSRNFSHQAALSCGYQFAKGDCVISLDADCQDPPEIIPEMIEKWQNGAMIVYAKRQTRDVDNSFKRITAKWFYTFINFLSEVPIPEDVGDFRLLDRTVVEFLNSLPEHSKFLRGLVAWTGFPTDYVYFKREKRFAGQTHYTFSKMLNFAMDGITSFSTKPLRLASYFGFICASIGFLGVIYALIGKIFQPPFFPHDWVTGWTLMFVGVMFIGGVQLITIGIIGEYISKIFTEVQKRPPFIVKERVNV
ncbi:MAG: glycosyltransferase family 2 protein [Patescibacteria group bacterium]